MNKEKEHLAEIKNFVNSKAWKDYVRPLLNKTLQGELPKPNRKGWEEQYRYYYAFAQAFSTFINALENLANKDKFMKRIEKSLHAAIDEA